jgi:PAS domain S-box-containing protein
MWVHDECVPVRDDTGQIIAWQGVLLDITPRVEAQAALVASETRFRTAFANAPIGMALVNLDGGIMQVNDALCAMLGYTAPELVGKRVQDLMHPDEVPPSLDRIALLLAGERETFQGEKRQVRKNGELGWVYASVSLVRDEAGLPDYIIAQIQDITERKRSVDELREAVEAARDADRARRQFVAVMSHELRTPMQAVLGYSELLHAQLADRLTPEQQADFTAMHQGALRVVDVVNDLLDLSRLNTGRLELVREQVELGPILEQVRQDVASHADGKGLTLTIDLPASLPTVLADPVRLRRIVLNLVGNAVKFTEQGTVRVSASVTDATLYVRVSDTGIGMAPEVLPLIFDEFYQVDSDLTHRQTGTGLGLAIARKLAEQHGGRITVTSQPAVGSTFTLELPAAHLAAPRTT